MMKACSDAALAWGENPSTGTSPWDRAGGRVGRSFSGRIGPRQTTSDRDAAGRVPGRKGMPRSLVGTERFHVVAAVVEQK